MSKDSTNQPPDPPESVDPERTRPLEETPSPSIAPTELPSPASAASDEPPPERIGPYRILRKLGAGGMGDVWEAEQTDPIRRTVALKLIKWGMDTGQFLARFASERQALALMSHPCIARVYDAGATETGRPYFAMELAPGAPLTTYCDEHRLTTRGRLDLFLQVCDGVQHAHQKGVIHRDLKPSNVLVTELDGKPAPKIIDFGLAKATEQRLTGHTVATELGTVMGTPEYMSPEQVDLDNPDIDTRTDVYSLGVMLYELLTGTLPLPSEDLRKGGFSELQRRIREEEPAWPSSRVRTAGEAAAEWAQARQVDVKGLDRQIRGDLDWIVMKALEKNRGRRYGSPSELAADIRRHLDDEPVEASPPSAAYRVGKFLRRHRVGATAAALVLAALIAGIVGTTTGLLRAQEAEAEAISQEAVARDEALAATTVSDFLVDLFEVVDPGEARGNTITAREILDRGTEKIERQLGDQPLMKARLQTVMGRVYLEMGLHEPARALLQDALAIRERETGEESLEVAETLEPLALNTYLGFYEWVNARDLMERALKIRRNLLSSDHPDLARALNWTGIFNIKIAWTSPDDVDSYRRGLTLLEEALEIQERVLHPGHPDYGDPADTLQHLGVTVTNPERKLEFYRRAHEVASLTHGKDYPQVIETAITLGRRLTKLGRYQEAETLLRETVESVERVYDTEEATRPAYAYTALGTVLMELERYEEAAAAYRRADEFRRGEATRVPGSRSIAYQVGRALWYQGREEEAEEWFQEGLRSMEELYRSQYDTEPHQQWAAYHALHGDRDAAMRHLRAAYEQGIQCPNPAAAPDSCPVADLPDLSSLRGDPEFEEMLAEHRRDHAIQHPWFHAVFAAEEGDGERALDLLRRAIETELAQGREIAEETRGDILWYAQFDFLHETPEFQEIIAMLDAAIQEQEPNSEGEQE